MSMRHSGRVGLWVLLGVVLAWGTVASAADEAAKADQPAKKADPSGTWKWTREGRDGQAREQTLKLAVKDGKLTGKMTMRENEREISNGTIEGDKLAFDVTFERDGNEFKVHFEGQLDKEQNAIDGKVSLNAGGESREFDWKPKRSVEAADVAGTWNIKVTTNEGQVLEPSLTLESKDGKLSGNYDTGFGQVLPVKEAEIKDAVLLVTIAAEGDGQSFTVKYNAKPRGDSLTGKVDYDINGNTGSLDFEGKRAEEKKAAEKPANP